MKLETLREGVLILEAAFIRKYPKETTDLFWREFKLVDDLVFLEACNLLSGEASKLPVLPELKTVIWNIVLKNKREAEQRKSMALRPKPTDEEFQATSAMLKETIVKLKAKDVPAEAK